MKIVLCFILLFNFCVCYRDTGGSEIIWSGNEKDGIYNADFNNNDHQTYGDSHNSIIRPCPLQDRNCIRRVFAGNSKCKPVQGPAPDPYMLQRLDLPVPQANLTFTLINAQVKGLNEWKVKEFFINKATERLVLEVEFDKLIVASPGARTTVYRKGKEPVEVTDYSFIQYHGISFTLTIPHVSDLQLSNGQVFTYVPDANPHYVLGPAVAGNKDPDFINCVAVWLNTLDVTMREVWASQGPPFMSVFLQSNICDFRHHKP